MRKKNPCLSFSISNSPLLYSENSFRINWCHRPLDYDISSTSHTLPKLNDLQSALKESAFFQVGGDLPKSPQTYIADYGGATDLKIYEAVPEDESDGDINRYLLVQTLIFEEPKASPNREYRRLVRGTAIEEPWKLFYDLAWMEDICTPLKYVFQGLSHKDLIEIDGYDKMDKFSDATRLDIIGDNPQVLRRRNFVEFLIEYLEIAKEKQGEERKTAKKLLSDCLVPKINKSDDSCKRALARDLMLILATELKKRCEITAEQPIRGTIEHDKKSHKCLMLPEPFYTSLKKKNRDTRIAVLSRRELSSLLLSPRTKYVKDLLGKITV